MSHVPESVAHPAESGALLARDEDTWVPKLKKDSEFWQRDPVAAE